MALMCPTLSLHSCMHVFQLLALGIYVLSKPPQPDSVLVYFQYLMSEWPIATAILLDTTQLPSSEDVVEIVSSRDAQRYYVVTERKVCVCVYVCVCVCVYACACVRVCAQGCGCWCGFCKCM